MFLSYRSLSPTMLIVIFSLALLPFTTLDAAVGFATSETDGGSVVVADAGTWSLRITKNPLQIRVVHDSKTIAATAPGQLGSAKLEGGSVSFNKLVDWSSVGDGLLLELAAKNNAARAFVSITPFEDRAAVRVWLPGEPLCEQIEQTWSLAESGHWYGGNITSTHNWPLEAGQIELDPFLATSNQTTPVWLASSGAGFFVPTYQPMGFAVNRGRRRPVPL